MDRFIPASELLPVTVASALEESNLAISADAAFLSDVPVDMDSFWGYGSFCTIS
ncbi:hypothetical a-type peptide pheromone precursor, partial [Postia placenta Mad-698-R]